MRTAVALVILVAFTIFTCGVMWEHGLFGFLALAGREPWGLQMFLDLLIALFVASCWMKRDARTHGLPFAPYAVAIFTLGSMGFIPYLVHRALVARRTPVHVDN